MSDLKAALEQARAGGPSRHREKSAEQGKLPVRERVTRLLDPESFDEEALLASWETEGLGAEGVVTPYDERGAVESAKGHSASHSGVRD